MGFGLGVGLGCGCFERRGLDLEAGGLVAPRRLRRGGRLGERADRAEAEDRLEARGDRGELGAQLGLLRARWLGLGLGLGLGLASIPRVSLSQP